MVRWHAERFATTRMTLVVIGALSGLLAYSTYHSYTQEELPTRNLCVLLLIMMCVVGLGTAAIRPNPKTRSTIGACLMLHSVLRSVGLVKIAWLASSGHGWHLTFDFIGNMNGVYVHSMVFYLGYLVWARSRQTVSDARRITEIARARMAEERAGRGGEGDL